MNSSTSYAEAPVEQHALTSGDRDLAQRFIQQTRNGIAGAIKGVSGAQWSFTPSPESWSIAQIVEHIVFVLDRVGGPVRQALPQAAPSPAARDSKLIDAIVIHQFPTRLNKFPAPGFACPAGRFQSPSEAHSALEQSYAALSEFLESTPDLREHALEAPPLRAVTNGVYEWMDGYQWILAAAAHTERHTKQILEIKADANFPAN